MAGSHDQLFPARPERDYHRREQEQGWVAPARQRFGRNLEDDWGGQPRRASAFSAPDARASSAGARAGLVIGSVLGLAAALALVGYSAGWLGAPELATTTIPFVRESVDPYHRS
jgi:hypothetical protein